MGMAASQARLLMLTSRLHDVELKAQQLQNAKLQLSTQQDAIYEDYQKALDATTLTMQTYADGLTRTDITATFSNVFGRNAYRPATMGSGNSGYILVDSRGRVVVEDDIYDGYRDFIENLPSANAQSFAYYMLTGEFFGANGNNDLNNAISDIFMEHYIEEEGNGPINDLLNNIFEASGISPMSFMGIGSLIHYLEENSTGDYQTELQQFMTYFFQNYCNEIFNNENVEDNYDLNEFNYYVRIYNAIQQHGGCISIDDFNGDDGSAATNSEWLTAMLQSGQMSLETISIDNHGEVSLTGISVASDTNLTYTTTTQIDKVAMAKAEADYEHAMKVIDRKEQKIDLELKKIETERTAITKEYDSIKKVSDDNIDRTFGIFS